MIRQYAQYAGLAAALTLLAACSADNGTGVTGSPATGAPASAQEEYGQEFVNGDELPVSYAVSDVAATRTDPALGGDFRVCAWMYDDSNSIPKYNDGKEMLWIGSETAAGTTYRGETVAYDAATGLWQTEETYVWPQNFFGVDFYATYPATAPDISVSTDNSDPEAPYTFKGVTLTAQQDNALVTDLLYAFVKSHKNEVTTRPDKALPLTFGHAFTRLSFYGATNTEGWHVSVAAISLHNIYTTATFDLKRGQWNAASLAERTYYNLTMNSNTPVEFTDETVGATPLTSTASPRMAIGQPLTAWDPATESIYGTPVEKPATTGCYLKISCRIYTLDGGGSEVPVFPGDDEASSYDYIYVPFTNLSAGNTAGWEAGRHYRYTLTFGAGYDDEGNPNIEDNGIQLTVAIADWTHDDEEDDLGSQTYVFE